MGLGLGGTRRRGSVAAPHESAFGPKQKCVAALHESAFGGKADMECCAAYGLLLTQSGDPDLRGSFGPLPCESAIKGRLSAKPLGGLPTELIVRERAFMGGARYQAFDRTFVRNDNDN